MQMERDTQGDSTFSVLFSFLKKKSLEQIWHNAKALQSWMVGAQQFLLLFSITFLCFK